MHRQLSNRHCRSQVFSCQMYQQNCQYPFSFMKQKSGQGFRSSFTLWDSTSGFPCWPNLRIYCLWWVSWTPSKNGAYNAEVLHFSYQFWSSWLWGFLTISLQWPSHFVHRKAPACTDQGKKDAYNFPAFAYREVLLTQVLLWSFRIFLHFVQLV